MLRRADGLFAYQLAVVADDAEAGLPMSYAVPTWSTRHRARSACSSALASLRRTMPTCPWRPTRQARNGRSRRWRPPSHLPKASPCWRAMRFLGQPVPEEAAGLVARFLDMGRAHWSMAAVPCRRRWSVADAGQCLPP